MARLLTAAALAAVVALAAAAQASPAPAATTGFLMPSRNIACLWVSAYADQPASLRCDIRSGLRPEPTRACEGDWTGLGMNVTGKAGAVCAGDTTFGNYPVLAYGRTWRRGGFTCLSRTTGLRCTNLSGHGFFLAREGYRLF